MVKDLSVRTALPNASGPFTYSLEENLELEQLEQLINGGSGLGVLPVSNMPRSAGFQNLAAGTSGVMQGSMVYLRKGQVINRIGVFNRTTAGATLTHRWVALYVPGGATLARQSTDITTATTGANSYLEFSLSSAYTVAASGLHPVGIMFAGTTIPTLGGATLGIAAGAAPPMTGVTVPKYSWTSGTGLTATAPASITFANETLCYQFWLY